MLRISVALNAMDALLDILFTCSINLPAAVNGGY